MNRFNQKKERKRKIKYEWRLKKTIQKFFDEFEILVNNKSPTHCIIDLVDKYGYKVRNIKMRSNERRNRN